MKKTITINAQFVQDTRKSKGLNQAQFWGDLGVTQSGGSRYESGRNIPKPVKKLIWLVHVIGLDKSAVAAIAKV